MRSTQQVPLCSVSSFTEWIEDKVLREEFPNDVDKWEKEHMHLRKPMESEKVILFYCHLFIYFFISKIIKNKEMCSLVIL